MMFGFLGEVVYIYNRKVNVFWNIEERKMDGIFKFLVEMVEGSNLFVMMIWEGEFLKKYYCFKVRE